MTDPTEPARRATKAILDATAPATRQEAEEAYGEVWDTTDLQREYTVEGFMAPYVVVRRQSDGARGTLAFSHRPRWYHSFSAAS